MRFFRFLAAIALVLAADNAVAYTVPGDFATIPAAILGVPDGSTVEVAPGVYPGGMSLLKPNKNVYIHAVEGPDRTFIDGGGTSMLLKIDNAGMDPAKNLVFDGFTFRNGLGAPSLPAVVVNSARPTFLNCVFSDNSGTASAGAVRVQGAGAKPSFVNCAFRNNRSTSLTGSAGAVFVSGSDPEAYFKGCLFENNSNATGIATQRNEGGAIFFSVASGVVEDCVFRGNSTDYAGGAIMVLSQFHQTAHEVVIRGSRFENNRCAQHTGTRAPSEGGAVTAEDNVTLHVLGSLFTGNVAESGGAIQSYRANLTVVESVFDGNTANGYNHLGMGGAIAVNLNDGSDVDRRKAAVTIQRTMIRNNVAPVGGGIHFTGDIGAAHPKVGTLTLADVTFESNRSTTAGSNDGHGGGLFLYRTGCTATRVYLLRNTAEGFGGAGAMVDGSSLTLTDSLVAGNTATVDGMFHPASAPVTFNNTPYGYNNGVGAFSATLLAATPRVTVGGRAYLAYFAAPYPTGLTLSPGGGALANNGGYAAGSVKIAGVLADTTYTLSGVPQRQAQVTYAARGLTDTWFPSPVPVPGLLEAEDFDRGGEALAYHDLTAANEGGSSYRAGEGVDVSADAAASNGQAVVGLRAGEWLDYTVTADREQYLELQAVVSAAGAGGRLYVAVDGEDATGVRSVPATGGWESVTLTEPGEELLLTPGQHAVRVVVVQGGFSLDCLEMLGAGPRARLVLGAAPAVVGPGGSVTLSGTLTLTPEGGSPGPAAGETVTIEFRDFGAASWQLLRAVVTNADGIFSTGDVLDAGCAYRASWAGGTIGGADYPAVAGSTQVQVQPTVALEVGGFKRLYLGYYIYALGKRVNVSGSVSPVHAAGQVKVTIQKLVSGKWKTTKTSARLLDAAGSYFWAWKPGSTGKFRIVTTFAGDVGHLPATSVERLVRVR